MRGDARADLVVPIAVELVAVDIDAFKFLVGDLDAGLVGFCVEFGVNLEACLGGGSGDEAYDGLETAQWLAAPVLADVGKEAMLDLVPFAGTRRKVTDNDPQAGFVGEFL